MQLIKWFIVFFIFSVAPINEVFGQAIKAISGFIIYNKKMVNDSIPYDVVFIPAEIDKNINLEKNIKKSLFDSSNHEGYFMYFQNMRVTQPNIKHTLSCIDTSSFLMIENLKRCMQALEVQKAMGHDFPDSLPGNQPIDCDTEISMGTIVFDNSESTMNFFKRNNMLRKEKILKEFTLTIDNESQKIKYAQFGYINHLGSNICFLPFKRD